jgi:hypothetical protein
VRLTTGGGGFTADDVAEHVRRQIGPIDALFYDVGTAEPRVDLAHVRSTPRRPYEVVVTSGMSALPMAVPATAPQLAYADVLALLPRDWPIDQTEWRDERAYWPIRLLRTLARYPHQTGSWLGFGHTVGNGNPEFGTQPYSPGTALCAAMLMPPLTLGRTAWVLRRPDGRQCCFWAVVPLHASELRFKARRGIDALLERFDRAQVFDRIDPDRSPVA